MSNLEPQARQHAFASFHGRTHEGVTLASRRGMLKAGIAGIAGLSVPNLIRQQVQAAKSGSGSKTGKSVILLWMAGGPSHIDTWDPKPDRPYENRGPFDVISTRLPGIQICEHLPKQAAMLDKFTIIRSVDSRFSNHEPNKVLQTANLEAEPRLNPKAEMYPAIGSVVAKFHGANRPGIPPYVACMKSRSHVAFAGYLGKEYDPFIAQSATKLPVYTNVGVDTGTVAGGEMFHMPIGLDRERLGERKHLLSALDRMRSHVDSHGSMQAMDVYSQMAVEMVTGRRAQEAFDLSREPQAVRDRYGKHLWHQQALLARRLVESGVAFVTLDLSHHSASGTWDTHGDNIPPYGGISKGLGPLLPIFDHLISTLVADLEERGLLENVLVIAMGEFGRTPQMGTQGSTDGRNHWPEVMSMTMAGGGFRHGQIIGATESDGGHIRHRPISPADIAATIYHHMGVPLTVSYEDDKGRPHPLVDGGRPITELI